jgi:heme A synthase
LLALEFLCWLSRKDAHKTTALAVMLTYNLLVTAYLASLGFDDAMVGVLLWPAIVIHAALALLFAWLHAPQRGQQRPE